MCRQSGFDLCAYIKGTTINLKDAYDREKVHLKHIMGNDPIEFVHRYRDKDSIEIAGFIASQFAYGKIEVFKRFLEALFLTMGKDLRVFVEQGDLRRVKGLYYRFHKDKEIIYLFEALRRIYHDFGGLGSMFRTYYEKDTRATLFKLRKELFDDDDDALTFFFPKPSATSALKRWNLYLRWMVRKDEIDLGIWDFIDRSDLVIPLDTHIFKIGRCLGFTRRATPSYGAAFEITDALKKFSPEDPLKYDFFLCHRIGIGAGCTGTRSPRCNKVCSLYEL